MMTIKVTLEDKTKKKLDKTTCETLRKVISEKVACDSQDMKRLLWSLTFNPEKTSEELGFKEVDQTKAVVIRAELARYYRKFHPTWDYGCRYTPETEEQKQLLKALKGDSYAYDTVMYKIKMRAAFPESEVEKIVYLTSSSKDNYQHGGIRAFGFRADEANFLKNAAEAMGKVLKAMATTAK